MHLQTLGACPSVTRRGRRARPRSLRGAAQHHPPQTSGLQVREYISLSLVWCRVVAVPGGSWSGTMKCLWADGRMAGSRGRSHEGLGSWRGCCWGARGWSGRSRFTGQKAVNKG